MDSVRPAPLIAVARLLADRGVYGLVWLDADLSVASQFGRLSGFVEIGRPVTDCFLPLIGFETELKTLADRPGEVFELPAVAVVTADGASPRLNIAALWSAEEHAVVLLISRAMGRSDLEAELSRQMRARLIAEAEVSAKSRELARANAELARANADLEEYATIISHDLKSPLRAMRYLIEEIEHSLAAHAEEADHERFQKLRGQSLRMSGMLSALLEYARAGRKEEAIETIDTGAMIAAIVRAMPVKSGFHVSIGGLWPEVSTLAAPLDLVLRNLIDNALKHHDGEQGRVEVTAADRGSMLEVRVADDGPGIAVEHQAVIFLPFRRLDAQSGRDGHGMGLAFVKRTVEAAGGALCVHSCPQVRRGTEFILSWPKS